VGSRRERVGEEHALRCTKEEEAAATVDFTVNLTSSCRRKQVRRLKGRVQTTSAGLRPPHLRGGGGGGVTARAATGRPASGPSLARLVWVGCLATPGHSPRRGGKAGWPGGAPGSVRRKTSFVGELWHFPLRCEKLRS